VFEVSGETQNLIADVGVRAWAGLLAINLVLLSGFCASPSARPRTAVVVPFRSSARGADSNTTPSDGTFHTCRAGSSSCTPQSKAERPTQYAACMTATEAVTRENATRNSYEPRSRAQ